MIDGLPTLSVGAHKPGRGKACVMEYVALLAGESWTDSPACTHPVLARAAQCVNDGLPDSHRHELVPLIGRLFGTADTGDRVLSVRLAVWCARSVPQDATGRAAIEAAEAWADCPCVEHATAANVAAVASYAAAYAAASYAASYAAYVAHVAHVARSPAAHYAVCAATHAATAYYAAHGASVQWLTGLLDEYDRLTGRTTHREVTPDELADLSARVAAPA